MTIAHGLECPVKPFPITYLGLPLSIRRIHSSHLLLLVDRIRKKLSTWRASMLARGERLALVRHVLCAMPGHLLAAIILNAHILKLVNRVIRDLLWHGRKDTAVGHYAVNWRLVYMPLELGGLGARDLRRTGISIRTRWLWLQRTDQLRP
ncbi:Serine/threonine-protein kinase SMG1 [Hordeum vulgare]|nr:Serine/threonine-protein kinase SMG1 [Hordeum vulgare]